MALVLKDRVRETTTVLGTNDAVLLGAVTGFQSFAVVGNANTCYYTIADNQGNWEVGIGTYSTVGPTLARTTILESSNSNNKVSFPAGTKDVFLTYPAEKSVYLDENGNAQPNLGALSATQVNITGQGDLRLEDTTGGEYVALQAPGTLASSYTLTLPVDDGTNGQALVTDGNGVLSWSTAASGDVYGPASATDNAITRFDGTTGKLIQNSSALVDDAGNVLAGAGLVGAPAFSTTGDTNTGIFFPAADTIAFAEGGVEAMRIDSSGNVGIGTSPSSIGSGYTTLDIKGSNGSGLLCGNATDSAYLYADSNGTHIGSITAQALRLYTSNTERMRITSAGNVGIGTTSVTSGFTTEIKGSIPLIVNSTSTANVSAYGGFRINRETSTATNGVGIGFALFNSSNAQAEYGYIGGLIETNTAGSNSGALIFSPVSAGTRTERMRINSVGQISVAGSTTSFDTTGDVNGLQIYYETDSGIGTIGTYSNGGATDLTFHTNNSSASVERMRIDYNGNVGIGTTNPTGKLTIEVNSGVTALNITGYDVIKWDNSNELWFGGYTASQWSTLKFATNGSERMRITSGGNLLIGKTASDFNVAGFQTTSSGNTDITRSGGYVLSINRLAEDGDLVQFYQASTLEGTISVSGTTVSYNGGHLSRWAQTVGAKDESLVKGTVLSNLDEMNEYVRPTTYWTEEDELPEGVNVGDVKEESKIIDNEQLNKVKVSDVEGDVNVAGVFVNWSHDEQHNVDEINMAMTGDMIIRIAEGVVVQKGDLLMSAGDGTAKPQGDDIVRSKTIAKVTSNHVTCTYADGSYCVPCVLMAC